MTNAKRQLLAMPPMYRLTRLLFSPWIYLAFGILVPGILFMVTLMSLFLASIVGGQEIFEYSGMLLFEGAFFYISMACAVLPVLFVRAIIGEFWPNARPWLYWGPPPGASQPSDEAARATVTSNKSKKTSTAKAEADAVSLDREVMK
ncbi:MAG: hypothetical protein LBP94_05100 [Zoogloeaceae bacterium]|jgi:hypothetical protein|nr:hypothetical protein [Zoogloeaceae bacterium]